jgi:hypothetical protein
MRQMRPRLPHKNHGPRQDGVTRSIKRYGRFLPWHPARLLPVYPVPYRIEVIDFLPVASD